MPLIKGKSPKAFSKNVKVEMEAGKPQKQALAIAYSVKRKSAGKKKMESGGDVKADMAEHMGREPVGPMEGYAEGGEIRAGSDRPSADERRRRSLAMLDQMSDDGMSGSTDENSASGHYMPKASHEKVTRDNDESAGSQSIHDFHRYADGGKVTRDNDERAGSQSIHDFHRYEAGGDIEHDMAEHMGDEPFDLMEGDGSDPDQLGEGPEAGSRYYEGGEVHAGECNCIKCNGGEPDGILSAKSAEERAEMDQHKDMMAEGGMIGDEPDANDEPETEPYNGSIADAILGKKRSAVDDNSVETPGDVKHTPYWDDNTEAAEHDFDSTMDGMEQPEDSNMDSRDLDDEDEHDMVSSIRKKVNSRRK